MLIRVRSAYSLSGYIVSRVCLISPILPAPHNIYINMYMHIYVLRTEGLGEEGGGVGGGPEKSLTSGVTIGTHLYTHHPCLLLTTLPLPSLHPFLRLHPFSTLTLYLAILLLLTISHATALWRILCQELLRVCCVCVYTGVKLHLRNRACFCVVVCTCFIA